MTKTVALVFLLLTSLALGGWLVKEKQRVARQSVLVADLRAQVDKQSGEIQRSKAAAAELEQKRVQLTARNKAAKRALIDAQSVAAASPPATADAPPTPGTGEDKKKKSANPFADTLNKMMKDPAMKNMMRTTQAGVLKQMYGDLVKQWSLSPEETQTFYDLLLDKQMDGMDQGMKLLGKGPGGVDASKVAASIGDADAKLKASLGDNLYKQYQDYGKSIPGRLTVSQFQQQLASSSTPALTPDQSAVLLQTVTEENASTPAGSYAQAFSGSKGGSFSMDPAQVDQFMKVQGDLNDRIDARMANTLSAEQLRVLKEQQQQALAMQRMGMEMASKMMGPAPTP